jgi:hypothetical protein
MLLTSFRCFAVPSRSALWHTVPAELPAIMPVIVDPLPSEVVCATYPWVFQREACPVGPSNVVQWTEAERERAEKGEHVHSVEELCDKVCGLICTGFYRF